MATMRYIRFFFGRLAALASEQVDENGIDKMIEMIEMFLDRK